MALHSLYCAAVPLRNCSLSHLCVLHRDAVMQSHISMVSALIVLMFYLSVESTDSDASSTDACFCQVHVVNDAFLSFFGAVNKQGGLVV